MRASQPPPQTQFAARVSGSTTHSPYRQKFFHRQRSTIAPAGMRAALSISAIMKKKKAKAPAWAVLCSMPERKNPLPPTRP